METKWHNTERRSHHGGFNGCFEKPGLECIGPNVVHGQWTAKEKATHLCRTHGCGKIVHKRGKCFDCHLEASNQPNQLEQPEQQHAETNVCAFTGCTERASTKRSKYCAQHRRGKKQTCAFEGCTGNRCSKHHNYCIEHRDRGLRSTTCIHPGCEKKPQSSDDFCEGHRSSQPPVECAEEGCTTTSSSEYCELHREGKVCQYSGCRVRYRASWGNGKLCSRHDQKRYRNLCATTGCNMKTVKKYCTLHDGECEAEGCDKRSRNSFCAEHKDGGGQGSLQEGEVSEHEE